jgi:mannose-1-phosphate guanylyltransferase
MSQSEHVWALILAAGEGSRLRDLTSNASGAAVPKQYCTLLGGPTLLENTIRRAGSFALPGNISVIVAEQHRIWWQRDLRALPAANIVVQPRNRGSGNGVLLQLLQVAHRDPQALVVLLPSDQFVAEESVLARSIQAALAQVRACPEQIVLLGMRPAYADSQLGYIIASDADADAGAAPQRPGTSALPVAEFIEKPVLPLARQLIARGALWNAFILAASAAALLRVYAQQLPGIMGAMRQALADEQDPARELAALYERLPTVDFSRDLLCDSHVLPLRVLPVPLCGWSDLGTPECVARVLAHMPDMQQAPLRRREPGVPVNLASNFYRAVQTRYPVAPAALHQ